MALFVSSMVYFPFPVRSEVPLGDSWHELGKPWLAKNWHGARSQVEMLITVIARRPDRRRKRSGKGPCKVRVGEPARRHSR